MSFYVPELHDAHPGSFGTIEKMLRALPDTFRAACAVLVVPNWGNQSPVDSSDGFVDWLRQVSGELILHGYAHVTADTVWNRCWYGTPNESEFARLDETRARSLIASGLERVEQAIGRRPRWFCAPRWEQSDATTRVLADAGMIGWMRHDHLQLAGGPRLDVPAVWFDDGVVVWRRRAACVLRWWRVRELLGDGRPFRLALHPRDFALPETWREARALVDTLHRAGWVPVPLSQAVAQITPGVISR